MVEHFLHAGFPLSHLTRRILGYRQLGDKAADTRVMHACKSYIHQQSWYEMRGPGLRGVVGLGFAFDPSPSTGEDSLALTFLIMIDQAQFIKGWEEELEAVGALERSSQSSTTLYEEHGRKE